ncbi:hypothetical protein AB6A40_009758 [Gnathostoma spinigerum]|uniref:Uncharacterized protein n=1 Tax=Gnathostoma spinigerum TaxID=75299 RepID=A0ABD6EY22_9BILA
MSVIPLRTISGSLPVIFIEARLYGDPECVVNQLGFSLDADQYNIAMLTRTSRVMLVVGVGSYMMYRIFLRLWDRGFIWTVVDQLRLDSIPRSDCQILFQSAKYQRCNEIASSSTKSVDGCTRSCSACGYFSPRHRLSYSKHRPCISSSSKYDSDPSRRSGVPSNLRDGMQGVTFVNSRDLLSKLESEASEGLSQLSGSIASGCSASLRLVWDDQEWDDEFDFSTTGIVHRGQCPTPSSVSEMSEFRTAKEIFGAASPSPTPVEIRKACGSEDESPSVRGDVGESVSEDMELVHKNCMTDSRHFYETAIGSLTESEAQSLCSGRSNRSFMSLRQRAAANEYCRGFVSFFNLHLSFVNV